MKKVLITLLVTMFVQLSYGQKVYADKNEFDRAVKQYNDELDSYENYIKKINFYKNYVYPKSLTYPESPTKWMSYFEPKLKKEGIRFDNYLGRLHSNVTPSGTVHINFIESQGSNKLLITFDDEPYVDAVYTASTYKFNHPGVKPVYKPQTKKEKFVDPIKISIKEPTANVEVPVIKQDTIRPDGYYSEEIVERNKITFKVTIIKNGVTKVYKRVNWWWGGEYFFRDDKSISENMFFCSITDKNK